MPPLSAELRSAFEREVIRARDIAEEAAEAALTTLAVERDRPFDTLNEEKRALRRGLRARARQLGEADMSAGKPRLIEEIAYEHWHRMLFTRFLATNNLLMHPQGVAVTLEECAELAQEEGAEDMWAVATRYASAMLPGILREDDPALQVRFAPEGRHKLEQIVTDLPRPIFTSDDGLGWAYQFWQSKKKDEVNLSERKIGGADIAPVTQMFTEDYMVKFLLHNTLGAWWVHRHPDSPLNETFDYLRYQDDGTPAGGTFDGWPDKAAEVTMMDPCGGSGHFVVAAFEMVARMRMEEEGLDAATAGDAVIRENLHLLELDLRCTQIAAFNLTLAAWKTGGFRDLPIPNVVWAGMPVQGQLEDWVKIAGDDEALGWTLERLYHLFRHAPDLGSLIDPTAIPIRDRMFVGDYDTLMPHLEKALSSNLTSEGPENLPFSKTVRSILHASRLLSRHYTLVATNVPYLLRRKQDRILVEHADTYYPNSKNDLATVFVERCCTFCNTGGSIAIVSPVHWLFLGSYQRLREDLLRKKRWGILALLGTGAFGTISGEVVNVQLISVNEQPPSVGERFRGIDVSDRQDGYEKAKGLKSTPLVLTKQLDQLQNPDSRVILGTITRGKLLKDYADSLQGLVTGDFPRYGRYFWELPAISAGWRKLQSTVKDTVLYGGRECIIGWTNEGRDLANNPKARVQGMAAWGNHGVSVRQMGHLPATLYTGEIFDINAATIIPKDPDHLPAIWAFCSSPMFNVAVRKLDRKLNVTNATLAKVPFDIKYWQQVAKNSGSLPEPHTNEPTQWLFLGQPSEAIAPLHVAMARLLGYHWPQQEMDDLSLVADKDGIVCLAAVVAEPPGDVRLRSFLAAAYGNEWSSIMERQLLSDVDFEAKGLFDWMFNGFFTQHCKMFENRPFIWHIWDGRKDGFSALVNYHKLDHAKLERLIYTYLGDWINTQRAEHEQGIAGAEGRLGAALDLKDKLELILEGEPPYDIYVRWKPLHEQPIGWEPDLNDGVRLNIRPFVKTGILRSKFTIHWKKDRGKNPDGSERINDRHFTRAQKLQARKEAGLAWARA